MMTLIDEAAAGASPKVAKCLAASVTTRTNGVNACTDGIRRGDAEWIYSAGTEPASRTTHRTLELGALLRDASVPAKPFSKLSLRVYVGAIHLCGVEIIGVVVMNLLASGRPSTEELASRMAWPALFESPHIQRGSRSASNRRGLQRDDNSKQQVPSRDA